MNTMQNNTFIEEDRGGAALRISFHLTSLRDQNLPNHQIGKFFILLDGLGDEISVSVATP